MLNERRVALESFSIYKDSSVFWICQKGGPQWCWKTRSMKPELSMHHVSCSRGPGGVISCIYCRLEGSSCYKFPFLNEGLNTGTILL